MIGRDARERPFESWQTLASSFRAIQLDRIRGASRQVLVRAGVDPAGAMVAAGSGAFLVRELARGQHRPVIEFARLLDSRLDDPAALSVLRAGRGRRDTGRESGPVRPRRNAARPAERVSAEAGPRAIVVKPGWKPGARSAAGALAAGNCAQPVARLRRVPGAAPLPTAVRAAQAYGNSATRSRAVPPPR